MATLSAPWSAPASMTGTTHGEDFVGDVLLETDAARGTPDTMSVFSKSLLGSPKPEEKMRNIFRGSHWTTVLPVGHPSRMEVNC